LNVPSTRKSAFKVIAPTPRIVRPSAFVKVRVFAGEDVHTPPPRVPSIVNGVPAALQLPLGVTTAWTPWIWMGSVAVAVHGNAV
jgi:hypothetical protein